MCIRDRSTSAAQPFSAPLSPKPKPSTLKKDTAPVVISSVPAGTVLRGLNFLKGKQDPVALADDEYPSWLWTILADQAAGKSDGKGGAGGVDEGDLFSKSKKERRAAAKALRKQQLLNPESLAPKVPVYEQSVDLPGGDERGSVRGNVKADQARGELTSAMRNQRRARIKEDNFLRAMG